MIFSKKTEKKAHKTERHAYTPLDEDAALTKNELTHLLGYLQTHLDKIIKKTERFSRSPRASEKYREVCEVADSEIDAKKMIFLALLKARTHRFAQDSGLDTLAWWDGFKETLGTAYCTYLTADSTPEAYEDFKADVASTFWSMCDQHVDYEDTESTPRLR